MDSDDNRKDNIGHNRPHAIPERSFTTSTTYETSTSSTFTRGSRIGASIGSSQPPHGLVGFPRHDIGSSIMYGGTSGIGTTYGGFRPGLGDTAPSRSTPSKALENLRRDAEKSDWQFKIFLAAFIALCFGLFVWGMLSTSEDETDGGNTSGNVKTSNSSRGWTFWIPLGPLWIGYGSEGFQWSFQSSF